MWQFIKFAINQKTPRLPMLPYGIAVIV